MLDALIFETTVCPMLTRRSMMTPSTGELMMDVGTVLDGEAAVEEGLIDHLGGLAEAIDCLYTMIEEERSTREEEGRE